jgi:predicted nucleotidyltransferase
VAEPAPFFGIASAASGNVGHPLACATGREADNGRHLKGCTDPPQPAIGHEALARRTTLVNRDDILEQLRRRRGEIDARFAVERIGLFGSAARNELRDDSDVDVLVAFRGPATVDGYFGLDTEIAWDAASVHVPRLLDAARDLQRRSSHFGAAPDDTANGD